jgi:hypothetical protein
LGDIVQTSALLHKAVGERTSPFLGHIYPVVFVTGMPSAVYPFMMAMRIWTSATCRSKSRTLRRCPSSFMQCVHGESFDDFEKRLMELDID